MARSLIGRPLIPLVALAVALVAISALALGDASLNAAQPTADAATETNAPAAGTPGATPSAGDATPSADDATPSAGGDGATEVMVTIDDFLFEPPALEIAVGTTVTWTNLGGVPHVATARDGLFDSRNLFTDETYSYTFEEAGTFDYFCRYHPRMTGTIVVED